MLIILLGKHCIYHTQKEITNNCKNTSEASEKLNNFGILLLLCVHKQ